MGMTMLAEDPNAMRVGVSLDDFIAYQSIYHVGQWHEVMTDVWECAEVGQWQLDRDSNTAIYTEANMWGSLPL